MRSTSSAGSDFLFSRANFAEGIARLFDFGGTLTEYNESLTGTQADFLALLADWRTVGDALSFAEEEFFKSLPRAS